MNKQRIYLIVIGVLLLSNVFLLVNMFRNQSTREVGQWRKKIIIEKLHFDASQCSSYDALITKHRSDISTVDVEIRQLKNVLYTGLQQENNLQKDSLITLLGQKQQVIEQINYSHFQDIRKLCHPDQMDAFNALSTELSGLFRKGSPRKSN
ncbi:MAG: hypothetical protein ACRCYO_05345 [Bacteroidia bacterium]